MDVLLGGKELEGDGNVASKLVKLHHRDEWLCVRFRSVGVERSNNRVATLIDQ